MTTPTEKKARDIGSADLTTSNLESIRYADELIESQRTSIIASEARLKLAEIANADLLDENRRFLAAIEEKDREIRKLLIDSVRDETELSGHFQELLKNRDKEIEQLQARVKELELDRKRFSEVVSGTNVDVIKDIDGTFFTQKVVYKEMSIGNIFRIVISD